MIEGRDGRVGAARPGVEQDVAAAVAVVDLVIADAASGVVAEESPAGVAGAIVAVDVPAHVRGRLLASPAERADVEASAPAGHGVPRELVRGHGEVVSKEIQAAAMTRFGLGPIVRIDEVALDGD